MSSSQCSDYRGVAEVRFDVVRSGDGTYLVTVRHRHYMGEWSSWREQYAHLSAGEALDIFDAELTGVGFRHAHLHGEQLTIL